MCLSNCSAVEIINWGFLGSQAGKEESWGPEASQSRNLYPKRNFIQCRSHAGLTMSQNQNNDGSGMGGTRPV